MKCVELTHCPLAAGHQVHRAKLRRVALADRLGKLALELQEREEELEQHEEEVEESQDMIAPIQENPFLNNRETSSAKPVKQYIVQCIAHPRGMPWVRAQESRQHPVSLDTKPNKMTVAVVNLYGSFLSSSTQ